MAPPCPDPQEERANLIGDPTYADAILDRLVHNAHRIGLTGESIRKTRSRAGKRD
jgi:DNA replication protein DnaC